MRAAALILASAGVLLAAEPKPLTEKQRTEALAAALSTLRAENAIHQLEAQYREAKARLIAEYEKQAKAEQALVKRLQGESGADGCTLTEQGSWDCSKVK